MLNELSPKGFSVGTFVGVNKAPFRPFEILSISGNRAIVCDGLTKKKNLPLTNIRLWDRIVSPNTTFRQGKKPTTDFQTLSGYEAKNAQRKELENRPESFVVEADFDGNAILPKKSDESKSKVLLLFGFHEKDQGELPMLMPFPLKEEDNDAAKLNGWLTEKLKPVYAEQFNIDENVLRFPLLRDLGPILSPYMRQEIGYALMSLALETDTNQLFPPSERMQKALLNTGNMFLLSVGVRWQVAPRQLAELTEAYNRYFAQTLGPIPEKVDKDIEAVDALLRVFKDKIEVKAALGDMTELFDLGQGGTYMLHQIALRGGRVEIVHGPRVPVDYGTPVGASFMGLKIS